MQTIYLDISNKGVIPCIQAKQSEVGRKFLAVITDNGVPYNIPDGSLLSVWYEGDTDAGNYSSIEEKSAFSIDGNKVTVELVAQMLLKPGKGELCLSVTHGDGGETNTWNIPYCVEYKPGAGSDVPTEYYTALTEAGSTAAKYANEASEYANQSKEYAAFLSLLFIESDEHPGCYYRMVDGEQEWINPPMVIDTEYRTTERYLGKPVFVRVLGFGELPNNTYKSFPIEDFGAETFIFAQGVTSGGQLFPFASITLGNTNISGIDMYVTRDVIAVRTYINRSHQTAEIKIKYTKEVTA